MANTTLPKIVFKNFGNYDLTRVMDLSELEDLDIPVQNTEATFVVTGENDVNASVKPKVPDSVSHKILARKLKEENIKLYNELYNPSKTRSLGGVVWSAGPDTEIFTKVLIE